MAEIKVFAIDDYEWYAGESLESCIAEAGYNWGMSGEELDEAVEAASEISEEYLTSHYFSIEERDDFLPTGGRVTMRAYLDAMIAGGQKFPIMFCSTEY